MDKLQRPRQLFRRLDIWLIMLVVSAAFLVTLGVLASLPGGSAASLVGMGAVAAIIVAIMVKGYRAGIEVDAMSVTVRRYVGAKVAIPWSEVQEFVAIDAHSRNGQGNYIAVALNDGRILKTTGLQSASPERTSDYLSELEATRPAATR